MEGYAFYFAYFRISSDPVFEHWRRLSHFGLKVFAKAVEMIIVLDWCEEAILWRWRQDWQRNFPLMGLLLFLLIGSSRLVLNQLGMDVWETFRAHFFILAYRLPDLSFFFLLLRRLIRIFRLYKMRIGEHRALGCWSRFKRNFLVYIFVAV